MNRLYVALIAAIALLAPAAASARMFDGYLSDCSAVTTTSCTELTTSGYARQPISFAGLAKGLVTQATPYYFPSTTTGSASIAGRAIYDAPTGGNLIAVIPLASTLTVATTGDHGDVGSIQFTMSAYPTVIDAYAITTNWPAGTAIATTPDGSTVTAGQNVQVLRGVAYAYQGDYDPLYSVGNTETTGFAVTIPNSVSTYGITGAGTLATGTIRLQAAPFDGELQRIYCDVTVTALTVTAPTGYTFIGTAPTTCGASAPHLFQYFVTAQKVRVLF